MASSIDILDELFEETVALAREENVTNSLVAFQNFVVEMLPPSVLSDLEKIAGGPSFIEDVWTERFGEKTEIEVTNGVVAVDNIPIDEEMNIAETDCLVCERSGLKLTRHHVIPREVHKSLAKKFRPGVNLNETIVICRMCHSTIHRLFTNVELAMTYNTLDMLLTDDRFVKYAKWASRLPAGRFGQLGV